MNQYTHRTVVAVATLAAITLIAIFGGEAPSVSEAFFGQSDCECPEVVETETPADTVPAESPAVADTDTDGAK